MLWEEGGLSVQCLLRVPLAVTGVNVITTLFMSLGYSQSGIGQGWRVKQERTCWGKRRWPSPCLKPLSSKWLSAIFKCCWLIVYSSFRDKPKKSHHMLSCQANFPGLIFFLTSLTLSLCHCFIASLPGSYTHFFVPSKHLGEKNPTLVSEIKMSARNTVHSTENQPTPVGVGITHVTTGWNLLLAAGWFTRRERENREDIRKRLEAKRAEVHKIWGRKAGFGRKRQKGKGTIVR